MDIVSYLLGKKAGGGSGSTLQVKSETIASNGSTTINPDDGYDGMSKVNLNVNVQPDLESKSVTISSNTTTTITPTQGKDGLSSVEVVTNVPQGITPTGTINITTNGTVDVTNYASADVNVSGGGSVVEKDVNFFDYDGTLLHSYTASEFAELSAMPSDPTHTGLTADGWGWDLADAQTYVATNGYLDMMESYAPADGKPKIKIELTEGLLSPYLGLAVNGTMTIDWGDGSSTDQLTGTSTSTAVYIQHTYSNTGVYTITLEKAEGTSVYVVGSSEVGSMLLLRDVPETGTTKNTASWSQGYRNSIKEVLGLSIGNYGLSRCINLETTYGRFNVSTYGYSECSSLNFGKIINTGAIGDNAFYNCSSLQRVCCKSNTGGNVGNNTFNGCTSLKSIFLKTGKDVGNYGFMNCKFLAKFSMPSLGVVSMYAFSNCSSLKKIKITPYRQALNWKGTTINQNAFENCYSLEEIILDDKVNTFSNSCFGNCSNLRYILMPANTSTVNNWLLASNATTMVDLYAVDMRKLTSVPSTFLTNYLNNNYFVVADNMYDTFAADSKFSTYATNGQLIKASDFDAL